MAAVAQSAFSVTGKTAIITGAGSGINLAFARLLLKQDCNVTFADLSLRPEAQKLVDEHSKGGPDRARAVFVKTDVTVWDQLERMFQTTDDEFGGADIVCPGAGVYEPHWSNFWKPPGTPDSIDPLHGIGPQGTGHYTHLDINLTHPIRVTQMALSRWLSGDPPVSPSSPKRIIHISSVAGQMSTLVAPVYVASKHAINGFVRSLARLEDAVGVRVNAVAPGLIKTPLWTEHPEKMKITDPELDAWVSAEEVADAMLRCVEDPSVGGGSIMEITKGSFRKVEPVNDAGPPSGSGAANIGVGIEEVYGWLREPGWGVGGK